MKATSLDVWLVIWLFVACTQHVTYKLDTGYPRESALSEEPPVPACPHGGELACRYDPTLYVDNEESRRECWPIRGSGRICQAFCVPADAGTIYVRGSESAPAMLPLDIADSDSYRLCVLSGYVTPYPSECLAETTGGIWSISLILAEENSENE